MLAASSTKRKKTLCVLGKHWSATCK